MTALRIDMCRLWCAALVGLGVFVPIAVRADEAMALKVEAIAPALEAYIAKGMADFDVPGLAIGIVTDDRLVYG